MSWYYSNSSKQEGPIEQEEFDQLIADGIVSSNTLVWKEGMDQWTPYRVIAPPDFKPQSILCACGKDVPVKSTVEIDEQRVCGPCKKRFLTRFVEGVPPKFRVMLPDTGPAGFGLRAAARILDTLIISIAATILQFILGILFLLAGVPFMAAGSESFFIPVVLFFVGITLAQLLAPALYETYFVAKYAATPGKMVVGIIVVRNDDSKVTYGRAFGRFLGTMVSGAIAGLGYLLALFDDEKRALHDHMCDTKVIHK